MSLYGVTFAHKLLQRGDYPEALTAAHRQHEQEPDNPEPLYDRGRALAALGRQEEAVADFEQALALDREAQVLPDGELDDALFSAVVGWAQALPAGAPAAERVAVLERYRRSFPQGSHGAEADEWARRFRGELPTSWVKPRS